MIMASLVREATALTAFCLLLLANQGVNCDEQRDKIIDFHADCLDDHNLDEEHLHKFLDEGELPENVDFYHHLYCVARKAKVMDAAGNVDVSHFKEDMKHVIDPQNMDNLFGILQKCLVQRETVISTIKLAAECFIGQEHNL